MVEKPDYIGSRKELNIDTCAECIYTGCVSESGHFATLFFLVRRHWGGCRYRHFAANFKAI